MNLIHPSSTLSTNCPSLRSTLIAPPPNSNSGYTDTILQSRTYTYNRKYIIQTPYCSPAHTPTTGSTLYRHHTAVSHIHLQQEVHYTDTILQFRTYTYNRKYIIQTPYCSPAHTPTTGSTLYRYHTAVPHIHLQQEVHYTDTILQSRTYTDNRK